MKHIPISHLELIDGPYVVTLTTVLPDGQPQTTPVWCNRKEDCIFVNVMKGFHKEKNMRLNIKSHRWCTTQRTHCTTSNSNPVAVGSTGSLDHRAAIQRAEIYSRMGTLWRGLDKTTIPGEESSMLGLMVSAYGVALMFGELSLWTIKRPTGKKAGHPHGSGTLLGTFHRAGIFQELHPDRCGFRNCRSGCRYRKECFRPIL